MGTDASEPLSGVSPESVTPEAVDEDAVHAALSSENPLVCQRGIAVCETLATADVDAVRPFIDAVAALTADETVATSLRSIAVLDTVAESEPAALDGHLTPLVGVLDTDMVDVQLTGAELLGTLAVARPASLTPHVTHLVEAIRTTEPEPTPDDVGDVVADRVTRRTIREHQLDERRRRLGARRTLVNVVVAVTEHDPAAATDAVDAVVPLLDDVDPEVAGGGVDVLGELATADPAVVAPASRRLRECLCHDTVLVRARAVRALGHLGDDAAVADLRRVAADDEDENVRSLAETTADYLENR
ncbi:HEAT repeat domain-containing protein [Haloarchaeobius sp. HRN-SO-5]|uniref:HEAT repeat domain-containing protein n=1 Tax=Haloarchaeobius sp. HRN-SO-5 TaxID=3446118 RepID=UPI003EB9ABC3